MKQAHVTRKNRKVKRLRSLYPSVNIQVFYQKDFRASCSNTASANRCWRRGRSCPAAIGALFTEEQVNNHP
jgi:hypothetical protein